jgi:hypothetical protein
MTSILGKGSEHIHWYEQALADGLGVLRDAPQTIEEVDRAIGMLWWYVEKQFPGTFLVMTYDETTPSEVISHIRAMFAILPLSTLLIHKQTDPFCKIENVEGTLSPQERDRLEELIRNTHRNGKKVLLNYSSSDTEDDSDIRDDMRIIISLEPDFISTQFIALAKELTASAPVTQTWGKIFQPGASAKLSKKIKNYRNNLFKKLFRAILYPIEWYTGRLITIHTRPMYASGVTEPTNLLRQFPKCGLVLQGPLQLTRSFTLETVRLYKKNFPTADVIVSTWEGEDAATIDKLRQSGAIVLTSTLPSNRGPGNVNLQAASAAAGVREANRLGAEYVLKQRSDERIYNALALEMMVSMLLQFPPGAKSGQQKRIIFGNGGPAFNPYWMGEIVFGSAQDMMEYYSSPPALDNKSKYFCFLTELYLPSEYLKQKGWQLDWTVKQGLEIYKNCFIPLDWSMLDLYRYKYYRYDSIHQRSYEYSIPSRALVNFGEWLSILVDSSNKISRPEQRLVLEIIERDT